MKKTLILLSILTSFVASAQSIEINPNGGTNASAVLDLKSTTKGFLPPRMTNEQMRAIPNPAQGLLAFCTNCGTTANGEYYFYKGTAWVLLSSTTVSSFTSVGAVSDIATANGATVTSDGVLNLSPADGDNPGIVTKNAQTFKGAKTFSAAPVLSTATASKALFTDANKNIVSNEITGTGNVVMSNAPAFTGTVSGIDKTMVGLANVDNTSDANKPVSTATSTALANKVDKVSGERLINAAEITKLGDLSGTNTGDQTNITGNAATVTTNANLTGDVTSIGNATTVVKINGTSLSGLATGILKNTTITGVPTIAKAGTDYQLPITLTTTGTGAATLSSNNLNIPNVSYTLPTATSSTLGGVKIDGTSIIINPTGVLSVTSASIGAQVAGNYLTSSTGVTSFSGSTTGLTPASATTGAVTLGGILVGANGGTGVANTGKTITLGGNLTTTGAFTTALTTTANTAVTLPVTGTLATLDGTEILTNKRLTSPVLTGNPQAPTATAGTNNTQIATTEFVKANSVDLTTAQTIAGAKTFSSDLTVNGLTIGKGRNAIDQNTAIGFTVLESNTTGSYNTANGYGSLYYNTEGSNNTTNGSFALFSNTKGNGNIANGSNALYYNTEGSDNTAIGGAALFLNTTGNDNTANGHTALYKNTTGNNNTANGDGALFSNTEGSNNTANGKSALVFNTTGYNNTAIGDDALALNTTGYNNTAIGSLAGVATGDLINATAIGAGARVNARNKIQLGNGSVTDVQLGTGTNVTLETGFVKITGGTPSAGKVLTSNADGLASWATPSSGVVDLTGDVIYNGNIATVVKINGTSLSGLATGILKNTTVTGVPTIATAGTDYQLPITLTTTGSGAATLVSNTLNIPNESYTLPTATSSTLGGVKPDGTSIIINPAGVLSVTPASIGAQVAGNYLTSSTAVTTFNGSTTGLTPTSATTGAVTLGGILVGANGGTGVANTGKTITLGGNLTTLGAFTTALTTTANTAVTLPVTGTLATLAGTEILTNKTLTSPVLTGTPFAPTATAGTNTTQIATTQFVKANSVDLTTAQTIAGAKTFSSDLTVNGLTLGKGANGVAMNTAFGYNALVLNTSGAQENTAMGYNALASNTTGNYNTANGTMALKSNTTGYENTAIGDESLLINTAGVNNVAVGVWSLYSNIIGGYNSATGVSSLKYSTGSWNTAIGWGAGSNLTSGDNNLYLGYDSQPSAETVSNEITLGNSSITTLRAQVTSITALSDRRDKTNIIPIGEGLAFLKKLNPVSFTWNTRDKAKVGIKSAGFIAQELLALQKQSTIGDNLDLVSENNPEKLEARYGNLLPVIVKAIQEESAEKDKDIQELKTMIDNQQIQIDELKKMVKSLLKK